MMSIRGVMKAKRRLFSRLFSTASPAEPQPTDNMTIDRSLDQADMLKRYGAEPTLSGVTASRWRLMEMVARPPNSKLIRPTCHLERPKDDDIDNIYQYKGARMFEVVLHSCPKPFWWGIHGGRTGYKTSIYVPRLGRHVQTLINCYAKSRFEEYYQEAKRSQELESLDDSSKKFIKSFWRKLDAKGDQEAADEDFIAYQEAAHSRFAHDYKIPNYIGLTGKLSKEVMDDLEASTLKLGFERGSYVDSMQFHLGLRAALGVDVFMSILPAPFRKTPYLNEINVANVEVAQDKWTRVNHPLAYAVEVKESKLFFYY